MADSVQNVRLGHRGASWCDGLVVFAVSTALAFVLLWPLVNAYFWEIDDSELVVFGLTALHDGGWSVKGFMSALMQTEFNPTIDYYGRYRPVASIIRVLKGTALVSGGPGYAFAFHIIAFIVFFTSVGLCIRRYFSWPWVIGGLVVLAALPFNAGVWWWLSVTEGDAMLWLGLGLIGICWHDGKNRWSWPLLCVASALTIGFKENFILLWIPIAYLLWRDWSRRTLCLSQFVWLLLPLLVSIPVSMALLDAIFIKSTDFYGVSTRDGIAWSLVRFFTASGGGFFCYAMGLILLLAYRRSDNKAEIRNAAEWCGVTFLLMLGNYIFYRGRDYLGEFHHYGFPYQALFLLGGLLVLFPMKDRLFSSLGRREDRVWFVRPSLALFLGVVGFLAVVGIGLNAARMVHNVQKNTGTLEQFVAEAKNYQSVGVMATTVDNSFGSLSDLAKSSYLPETFFIPFFAESGHLDKTHSLLSSDTLLIGFGPPNKAHLLGTIWKKVAYFTHPWTNPHWFQRIEHTHAVRPMAAVFADHPFLPLTAQGDAVFRDNTTLYVPADHPQPGTLLLQTSASLPPGHCWRFAVNGQEVGINRVPQGMEIAITAEMWDVAPHHPQVLELSMKCVVDSPGSVQLPLGLLALVLNGSLS